MNRIFSWIRNTLIRTLLTLSLVGIAFLLSAVVDNGYSFQAQAEPLTPEATKYQVNSQDSPFRENDQEKVNELFKENKNPQSSSETTQELGETLSKPQKMIKKNIEKAADTTREKLNLDQPPYTNIDEIADDAVSSLKQNRD
ncbi:MAG: hypothetical protein AB1589_37805 [Cyanobacteriota bacterium]